MMNYTAIFYVKDVTKLIFISLGVALAMIVMEVATMMAMDLITIVLTIIAEVTE